MNNELTAVPKVWLEKLRVADGGEAGDLIEGLQMGSVEALPLPQNDIMGVIKAVAHIGVDFGYGPFSLDESVIEKAREIMEACDE